MHPRASALLEILSMRPHPEGGHYVELYRSARRIEVLERKAERSAVTAIYFLLASGEFSRWHRVMSDEMWHYHEGDAIELVLFDQGGLRRVRLGPVDREVRPTAVVPAGTWQTGRTTGAYSHITCTVGPGFEFVDFTLAIDYPEIVAKISNADPDLARFI